jgi:hypothetical protein
VRKEVRIRGRSFYSYRVNSHDPLEVGEIRYLGGEPGFSKTMAYATALASQLPEARIFGLHPSNRDLLILFVSAYCSALRCSHSNLN